MQVYKYITVLLRYFNQPSVRRGYHEAIMSESSQVIAKHSSFLKLCIFF